MCLTNGGVEDEKKWRLGNEDALAGCRANVNLVERAGIS